MSESLLKPTNSEMEILQVFWKQGASTVKDINTVLNEKKARGYTTTLKIMQIMADKGLLNRIPQGKLHIYNSAFTEEDIKSRMVDSLIEQVFEGAAMDMVMQALGNYSPSASEISELKELLARMEQVKK
ncbi:MAG: BlaI/MecI/CopY family transcriptional regulator [Saprospiraceae bacterium]